MNFPARLTCVIITFAVITPGFTIFHTIFLVVFIEVVCDKG